MLFKKAPPQKLLMEKSKLSEYKSDENLTNSSTKREYRIELTPRTHHIHSTISFSEVRGSFFIKKAPTHYKQLIILQVLTYHQTIRALQQRMTLRCLP